MVAVRADRDELKELLDAVDMESWLDSEGVRYRHTMGSRGPQLNVQECPVCGSGSYKVYLNAESGLGNCFSGDHPPGQNFNKFSFIRAVLGSGTPFPAVVDHIRQYAKQNGWRAKRKTGVVTKVDRGSPKLPAHYTLPINGKNLAYLENRGITLDIVRYLDLRYCHEGRFEYVLGDGMRRYQDYSRRVLIPVYDLDGKLVSFQGRDITGTAEKKYLFPPGFAATGEHLYNGHNVIGTDHVVVGEGAFDVAATKIALDGDPALRGIVPIGTFGKHLSHGTPDSQLAKFERLKNERGVRMVTIMWDGEVRATEDAIAAAGLLRGIGLNVRIAMLPFNRDPNEVASQEVRDAFYKAEAFSDMLGVKLVIERQRQARAAELNARLAEVRAG